MMSIIRLIAIAVLLAVVSGCATMGGPSPQQQALASHAESLYRQGQFQLAARDFLELADQGRYQRDHFRLRAAEAYREEGALENVAAVLEQVHRRRLDVVDAAHYDLLAAEAALSHQDPQRALALTGAPVSNLSPGMQMRALELRARAQSATGDPYAAAQTRAQMDPMLNGFDRAQNEKQILALLEGMDPAALQQRAQADSQTNPLQPWIEQALGRQGVAVASPLPRLDRPVGTLLPQPGQPASREGYRTLHQIALLLPQSGPLQAAAIAVRDGFMEAAQSMHQPGEPAPRVQTLDSGGDAQMALDAYHQAVQGGAELVVGPLAQDAVGAVFRQARVPVPVLALNHPKEGVLPPPGSAEFALLPETEGAQAAAHMLERGLRGAVIFKSEDTWADRATRAFRAQFESGGGRVLGTATLAADEVNYAAQIAAAAGGADTATGIFIALRPEQGRLLLPQLKIAGLRQPVFATSKIYAGEDNPGLDHDLDGVEFTEAPWLFDAQPGLPSHADLAQSTPTANGPAARLFAFGMDAWSLMPYLDWLRSHPGSYLPGATGQLTADSFGRIHPVPIWVHFVQGIAQPMTGGLSMTAAGH